MQNNQPMQRVPGMLCPNCKQFIPTTITELLTARSIRCPHCFLRLDIDRQQSSRALQALAKVEAAQQRVEKTSNHYR